MTTIAKQDLVVSIADALQFISYYHPVDFIQALHKAYIDEQSPAARDAIAQMLVNSRMCALGHRPICQDTGIVNVFLEVGMQVHWDTDESIDQMINQAVHRAYTNTENSLRASIVSDPAGQRINTGDNTPAVIHTELVPGNSVSITVAAKGGGSENKARFAILNPSDDVVAWVLTTITDMGAGWCPPGILGIGIGGTAEKAMLLAKKALLAPIDIQQLKLKGATNRIEQLRIELYDKVNQLGIGAQGLGGLTTVLDVKILDYPAHAASKPIAIIPNCAATRHTHFVLHGDGPALFTPPKIEDWPDIAWDPSLHSKKINLDTLRKEHIAKWQPGETLLLTGKVLTGRDAAHKRMVELLKNNLALPSGLDFTHRFIYYVGPVDPVAGEIIGPAGPTTATRMDKFTDTMLESTGLLGMIGKAERGDDAIASIKKHKSVYLVAIGGAAYLVAKAIRSARIVAFEDLGMEAIYEFEVEDMPVTVAVDSSGQSIHKIGPAKWRNKFKDIPISVS